MFAKALLQIGPGDSTGVSVNCKVLRRPVQAATGPEAQDSGFWRGPRTSRAEKSGA